MYLTNVSESIEAKYWVLGYVLTFNNRENELWKLSLNSSFCAVTADSNSRWPHGKKKKAKKKRMSVVFYDPRVGCYLYESGASIRAAPRGGPVQTCGVCDCHVWTSFNPMIRDGRLAGTLHTQRRTTPWWEKNRRLLWTDLWLLGITAQPGELAADKRHLASVSQCRYSTTDRHRFTPGNVSAKDDATIPGYFHEIRSGTRTHAHTHTDTHA